MGFKLAIILIFIISSMHMILEMSQSRQDWSSPCYDVDDCVDRALHYAEDGGRFLKEMNGQSRSSLAWLGAGIYLGAKCARSELYHIQHPPEQCSLKLWWQVEQEQKDQKRRQFHRDSVGYFFMLTTLILMKSDL